MTLSLLITLPLLRTDSKFSDLWDLISHAEAENIINDVSSLCTAWIDVKLTSSQLCRESVYKMSLKHLTLKCVSSRRAEIEEFQWFFVNPNPSSTIKISSDDGAINDRDLRNVEVRLLPEAAVVSVGRSPETYVVALKVKAPPPPACTSTTAPLLDPSRLASIDLVTVLDVSGSMTGAKLQMLKRAMRLVISSLGSSDRLSIIAFSACSKRLLPLRRMTAQGQRSTRRIIDLLVAGQGTSVGEALRKAAEVLEDRWERSRGEYHAPIG
ncbi:E3 ubiquitin-protein ligase WAV3-like [Macadamia integrifolia]|uniref:E3 ubiquitin-protein ligase WAV3-like n=1 Tax=Macadamia integrifolia TaxID=60698 RepID=UPI001C4FFE08|nr:E3 ubiquitin-protein ligase WAV3-like [Macadamia integrifolia]